MTPAGVEDQIQIQGFIGIPGRESVGVRGRPEGPRTTHDITRDHCHCRGRSIDAAFDLFTRMPASAAAPLALRTAHMRAAHTRAAITANTTCTTHASPITVYEAV